jgi:hypothetical protein
LTIGEHGVWYIYMLTPKQEKFSIEYLNTGNASKAYRMAYDTSKMKPATINRKAKELLDHGKITARLDELLAPALKKLDVTIEKTLRRLMRGQEFDVRNLYHPDGRPKQPNEIDDDTAGAIVGVKWTADGGYEYKIIDVKGCTELLGRHLGIFAQTVVPPAEDNSQHLHVHFDTLSYQEQQKLTQLAIDTMPGRKKPPVITQGDARPMGLDDEDRRTK